VRSGRVIESATAKAKDGVWLARIATEVRIDEPAWFAARIDAATKNELDCKLYAHTSPIYVDFAGQRVFDIEAARALQKQMEDAATEIRGKGKFGDDAARDKILAIYSEAATELARRIKQRGN
jgi:hypothetical protein